MIKINKLISFLERKFPLSKQEEWDKSGLHYGSFKKNINKILVVLDLTKKKYDYAISNQVDFIITHHPFRWEENLEEDIKKAPYKLKIHNRILNNNIGIYSIHTNFDSSSKGTSYLLAKKMGFNKIFPIKNSKYSVMVEYNGSLDDLKKLFFKKIKLYSKKELNFTKNKPIKKVGIIAGSGKIEEILELKKNNIKTIITSDVKWSDLLTMNNEKINLLLVSHESENVFVDNIKKILKNKFKKEKLKVI